MKRHENELQHDYYYYLFIYLFNAIRLHVSAWPSTSIVHKLFAEKLALQAGSYDKVILKTENGSFSTFAPQVCVCVTRGNERTGRAILRVRLAPFRDASNVFAISSWIYQPWNYKELITQNQVRTYMMLRFPWKHWPIFRASSVRNWFRRKTTGCTWHRITSCQKKKKKNGPSDEIG